MSRFKKYWWVGLLAVPVLFFLSMIRIRKVKTINYTDSKGHKFAIKGTVKRNKSNTGYIINGVITKCTDPEYKIGKKITSEFLDKDNKK